MDSIFHATRKIMIERRAQQQQQQQESQMPDVAPPAYCAEPPSSLGASLVDEADDDDDEEDGDDDEDPSPVTITLHANTNVQGTGNLIASPALADATRFSALLLAAVQSLNAKAEAAALANGGGPRPILNVQIVLDCGITINGDGNVVGHRAAPAQPAVAGPKRKAEEEAEGAPLSKRV